MAVSAKIGHGYDVHAFEPGDGFVLGGVSIDCDKAVVAHSDGDVLIHALCDALLGALGRGDIGGLFPDSDGGNRDRDSREFLRELRGLLAGDGYRLGNADITVIAQAPKISPHIDAMRECLAGDLGCAVAALNIKATTTEKLGFIGREEGIAAEAVVLLEALP
ncbi:MAG: 2-C-methyl-D-erythritol 2,4-cyclodiphosphate synthase [Gammaproteobacteria bacterium]|jgi:2-C-methyl-D-erythritol 2,4-cyclodiphosphate synthase